jgi:rhomboid protease GluP
MMRGPRIPTEFTVTYLLITVNVAVYIYTSLLSGNALTTSDAVLSQYGQNNLSVMNGAYWQLFTSMFVHVSIVHIFGNMLFLLIFGLRTEEMFNPAEYVSIYVLSGLTGNMLTLLYGPSMLSAGASGAIFGIFGATLIYMRRAYNQPIITALLFAFLFLVINIGVEVNVLAHLGGLLFGLVVGYYVAATRKTRAAHRFSYRYSF